MSNARPQTNVIHSRARSWGRLRCGAVLAAVFVSSVSLTATAQIVDIIGTADEDDMFGSAVATGDFDCDGRADIAFGVQGEDSKGAINVLYGDERSLLHKA